MSKPVINYKSNLRLTRHTDTDSIMSISTPKFWWGEAGLWKMCPIPFGFQLLMDEYDYSGIDGYMGESVYTVLVGPNGYDRSDILILHTSIDSNKILNKASISFDNDEDLRWIENIINKHFEQLAGECYKNSVTLEELTKELSSRKEPSDSTAINNFEAKLKSIHDLAKKSPEAVKMMQLMIDTLSAGMKNSIG